VTALLIAALAWGAEVPVRRFAVVVGSNDGGPGRVALRYAHRDADAMADVLTELGGVADDDLTWLIEPDIPTIEAALSDLRARLDQVPGRREVVFYYSGHSDEQGLLLGGARLEWEHLREALDTLWAEVRIAILDSCASGALLRSKGGRPVAPFLVDESSRAEGFAYIVSSTADEAAQEADRIEASFFTQALITGLRGAADSSADGRVTFDEAYHYAFDVTLARTERTAGGPQHAMYENRLSGTGDLVLTDVQRATSALHIDADVAGTVSLRNEAGRLLAEVGVVSAPVDLALPEGRYAVTVVRDGTWAATSVTLVPGAPSALTGDALTFRSGEPTVARGGAEPPESLVRVSLWPGLTDDYWEDHILFNPGFGATERIDGIGLGLGSTTVRSDARGLVGTFGANVVHGEMRGLSLALGYNEARAGMRGLQFALGGNHAGGESRGAQMAAGVNSSRADGSLFQFAFGANTSSGTTRGAQIAAVNHAHDIQGAQLGLVNVGGHVDGMQVGVVNVAGSMDGGPIGLINIVKDGRQALALSVTETDLWNVDLRFGGRQGMYTVLGGMGDDGDHAGFQAGIGGHVGQRFWSDFDVTGGSYFLLTGTDRDPIPFVRSRLMLGAQIHGRVGAFAGGTFTWRLPVDDAHRRSLLPSWYADPDEGVAVAWPGLVAGVVL
jgi:hypothetical protein